MSSHDMGVKEEKVTGWYEDRKELSIYISYLKYRMIYIDLVIVVALSTHPFFYSRFMTELDECSNSCCTFYNAYVHIFFYKTK